MHITLHKLSFKLLTSFGALALMIVAPAVSRATVVYSNLGAGSSSNIDGNVVGNDTVGDNLAQADTFTPTGNYTLTNIQLALSCPSGTCPNNYTVEILGDLGGSPNTASVLFLASEPIAGLGVASTTSLITVPTTISVLSGVAYWIVVLADTGGVDKIQWNWNTQGDASAEATAFAGGGSADTYYELGSTPNAYAVNGTLVTSSTPEPGTLGMMLGGGLLLGFLRKVRR